MKLTISKGNMKLGDIPNISLPPIKTCPEETCGACRKKCYAMKSYRQYPSVRKAWNENLRMFNTHTKKFWRAVLDYLFKHEPQFFRIHAGGDCPDLDYMDSWSMVAKVFPNTAFLMFTKRWAWAQMLQRMALFGKAPNLRIIVSRWPGDNVPEEVSRSLPQAWVKDPKNPDTRIPANAYECPGSCKTCKYCYTTADAGSDVVFHIH